MPVNKEITLIAKWEKIESSNNFSNGSGLSINKINLNDILNATIYYKDAGNKMCFFYMLVDNLKEIFSSV